MARRKQKCGLAGTSAEHAAEFQQARHEALTAVHDATTAMRGGKCLIAGKRIDEGYIAIGRMQATAQTGVEMAETSRVHDALEKADSPFETSCVRDEPVSGKSRGLYGTDAPRNFVARGGSHALTLNRPPFVEHISGKRIEFIRFAVGENSALAPNVVEVNVRLEPDAGRKVSPDLFYSIPADELAAAMMTSGSFLDFIGFGRTEREDTLVWLDQMRMAGQLAGFTPAAALIAASVPLGIPGVPFVGLGAATPEEIERAEARRVAREGEEPTEALPEDLDFTPMVAMTKADVAAARERADAQREEVEAIVSRRPAQGSSAPFVKELFGSPKLSVRQYNVTLNPKLKRKQALARYFEYPKLLIEGERQFELINEDKLDLTLTYSEVDASKRKAPSKRVVVRPAARVFPAAETPMVDPFRTAEQNFDELERRLRSQNQPPTSEEKRAAEVEAIRSFPATVIDEKAARELEAKRQWEEELKKPAKVKAPKHAQYAVGASELQRYHYATNDSAAFTEELYRVPRIEDAPDEAEKLIRAQVIVANLPTKMDVGGVIFTRGQMFTVGGQLVVSYRAYKAQGAFVPHDPTPEQRAANELFLNTLEELPSARSKPEFLKPWEGAPVASLLIEPQGVEVFTKGARTPWAIPVQRLELRHFSRKPDVIVELTAGRGYRFKTTMEALRAAPVFGSKLAFEVGNFTIVLPLKQANALMAWLAKSANSGLGEFDTL